MSKIEQIEVKMFHQSPIIVWLNRSSTASRLNNNTLAHTQFHTYIDQAGCLDTAL